MSPGQTTPCSAPLPILHHFLTALHITQTSLTFTLKVAAPSVLEGKHACACVPYVDVRLYGNLSSNWVPEAAAGMCSTPSIHQPYRDSAQWHAVVK